MKSDRARLNCGTTIPVLGFGTYADPLDLKAAESAVHMAVEVGYRHFDTAKVYGSEPAVGRALTVAIDEGAVEREDIFLTSKLWGCDHHDPVPALKRTLQDLGMEYLDMYLVHWPLKLKPGANKAVPEEDEFEPELDMEATWRGMERCFDSGLCRGIGVSNFSSKKIERLLDFASVPPAINQVEMHPMWRQGKLREVCGENKIHVSAYSPLGAPGNAWGSTAVVDSPIIQSIALKHNATPAQVALQWGVSKGASVIAKSFRKDRMEENTGALDLGLDDRDLLNIDRLEERKFVRADVYVNQTTSPYKTLEELWDDEI
ncbi:NADPH-dependent aldo-keto reductase, chloroplastic [Rhodamnia argentea]|uniref:NADPH-dependent aldo-keto reductase, chloroplastic n=1 Tax=Rhodamnia argentea TaxID=178133 RepID=A0A8B8PE55_9MYRT|nr:NADPH-dependent aldo-keto reductase, chloroplastic [Rhodamnia argentea]